MTRTLLQGTSATPAQRELVQIRVVATSESTVAPARRCELGGSLASDQIAMERDAACAMRRIPHRNLGAEIRFGGALAWARRCGGLLASDQIAARCAIEGATAR